MTVRSAVIVVGTSTAGAVVPVRVVGAGITVLLKDVRVYSAGGCARAVLAVKRSGLVVSVIDKPLPATGTDSREGFMVLEPGDEVAVYSQSGTFDFWCSGSELAGVAP